MQSSVVKPHRVVELGTEIVSDEHFLFERRKIQTETYGGTMSRVLNREVLRSGRVVVVLLYDPTTDQVVLTRQFRIGAYLNRLPEPWLLECVAGMVDGDEAAEAAARREVQEETGCAAQTLELLGEYLTSPGITDEFVSLFVARVDATTAGGVHGLAVEAEDIQTCVLTGEEAVAATTDGSVKNAMSQIALLWFALHRTELRQRWLEPHLSTSEVMF